SPERIRMQREACAPRLLRELALPHGTARFVARQKLRVARAQSVRIAGDPGEPFGGQERRILGIDADELHELELATELVADPAKLVGIEALHERRRVCIFVAV